MGGGEVKAHFKTRNNRLTFEVEGGDQKGLFEAVAELQEVFEADDNCGCCSLANIRFRVRTHDDNKYYELVCQECGAKLSFGQHKKGGTLFAKRTDESGPLPNRGWYKWQPKQEEPYR